MTPNPMAQYLRAGSYQESVVLSPVKVRRLLHEGLTSKILLPSNIGTINARQTQEQAESKLERACIATILGLITGPRGSRAG